MKRKKRGKKENKEEKGRRKGKTEGEMEEKIATIKGEIKEEIRKENGVMFNSGKNNNRTRQKAKKENMKSLESELNSVPPPKVPSSRLLHHDIVSNLEVEKPF